MAAAVAAADPTGCTTVGVVDDVVDDADDVVVVVVPALTAGGSEITWLPTVWVYLIGVDLVTVTLGTGMDLDTGGCWKDSRKVSSRTCLCQTVRNVTMTLTRVLTEEEAFKEDTTLVAVVSDTC